MTYFITNNKKQGTTAVYKRLPGKMLIIAILLLATACNPEPTTAPELPEEPITELQLEVEQVQEAAEHFEYEIIDELEYELEEDEVEMYAEAEIEDDYFEIYSIEGTADSMTGGRWERMLAWRNEAALFAEQYRDTVIVNMNPADNVVFLTFDDGPDPVNTVKVINTLIEYDVSATFFFTGENIRRHGEVVRQAHEAGFSLGLHGYSHISMRDLTADEIIAELDETNDLLEAITGTRSKIMRPPYGAVGHEEIEIIRGQNLQIYLWSLDTLDWAQDNAYEILRNIKDYIRPGDIILMHAFSGQHRVPEILPSIIEFIRDEGYEMRALT